MITGAYDARSCVEFPELRGADFSRVGFISTECAHLFSESAQDDDKVILLVSCFAPYLNSNQTSEYAGTAFMMLKMFGLEHEVEKVLSGRVNNLSNVLTLSHDMHGAFDRFAMWLEEVPGEVCHCASNFSSHDKTIESQEKRNAYTVEMAENKRDVLRWIHPYPRTRVTFKVDPECAAYCKENVMALPELPSQDLIALRAACARVANMSGAAEQADKIY
jgi:hypothetical protein